MQYIIMVTKYLTMWEETVVVKDCSAEIATHLFFENIVTRFGCPKILISD